MDDFLPTYFGAPKIMMFVDGENLAIRYKKMLDSMGLERHTHVSYEEDVFVWSRHANLNTQTVVYPVIRKYYYTSAVGDDDRLKELTDRLKGIGIEAPRIFKKERRTRTSKQVDISLSVDMLTNAYYNNYDIAVLVTGDSDFIPLVQAVMREGKIVVLWSLDSGLSWDLKREVDHFFDIGRFLFEEEETVKGYFSV